jgi:hypothetical protein
MTANDRAEWQCRVVRVPHREHDDYRLSHQGQQVLLADLPAVERPGLVPA